MGMEEGNETCGSSVHDSSYSLPLIQAAERQPGQKLEVYNEFVRRLRDSNSEEAMTPGFDCDLWSHFNRFSTRYALDLNVERAEDVLMHKRLLNLALDPANRPAIEVRLVQIHESEAQSGVMTAETGTYRWMAPEVIEHKQYDQKADVFSFAIVLWELLTGKELRPTIPKHTHPKLVELIQRCWQQDPSPRPNFPEIIDNLQHMAKEVAEDGTERRKEKSYGFMSVLRRGQH